MARPVSSRILFANQRGATVVEFAVVVLLLVTILFGILELSFIFLQRHFIANAAREGVRIGVRANNFNCFNNGDSSWSCTNAAGSGQQVYRRETIVARLTGCNSNPKGYLCTLYEDRMAGVTVTVPEPTSLTTPVRRKILAVTVTAPNFFPQLVSRLVPMYIHRNTISYTATGDYEDAEEP